MNGSLIAVFTVVGSILGVGGWLGWQLLRQNGRMLLRLDELEKRLDELEFGEPDADPPSEKSEIRNPESEMYQGLVTSAATNGEDDDRVSRLRNRSLARSKIKRDGLKAGTPAPDFRLPRLDGGELSLDEFRGKNVLLVFSDPHCGPCNALAPQLEKFHRATVAGIDMAANEVGRVTPCAPQDGEIPRPSPQRAARPTVGINLVIISRGEPGENRAKVKEHGLTFPVVLQQGWEISRLYAMFATPSGYFIDEQGVIVNDVAVGVEPILTLIAQARNASATRTSGNDVAIPAND